VEILTVFGSTCWCQRGELTLLQATVNAKFGPQLSLYSGFSILLVFSSFFAFLEVFLGDLGF